MGERVRDTGGGGGERDRGKEKIGGEGEMCVCH